MEQFMQKKIPESQAIIKIKNTLVKKEGETQQLRINGLVKHIPNKTIRNSCIF